MTSFELFTARNINQLCPLSFPYNSDFSGLQLLTTSCFNLGMTLDSTETQYVVKFVNQQGNTITVDPEKTIKDQGLKSGMTIYILPSNDESPLPKTPIRTMSTFNANMSILDLPQLRIFTTDNANSVEGEKVTTQTKATDIASDYGIVLKDSGQPITLLTYNKFNKSENPECTYYLNYSYDEMCETATRYLGIPNTSNLSLLLRFSDIAFKWFEPGHYLEEYNPIDKMKLSVFTEKITVTINTIHFPPRDVVIETKKFVKEIIPEIASKLNMVNFDGYSLFRLKKHQIDQKELLDDSFCIPMQTHNFSELYFERVFFVFTRKDLISFDSAMFAFRDARNQFLNGRTYCTESQIVELTAYSLIIDPPNGYEFDSRFDIPLNLIDYLPKFSFAIFNETEKSAAVNNIRSKLISFFQSKSQISRGEAIRFYLKTVRQIPSFASTSYEATVKSANKEYIDCTVVFCPQRLFIYIPSDSLIEHEIYYQLITEVTLNGRKVSLKYRKHARVFEEISLRSKKAEVISQLLNSFIQFFKNILRERAIEKAQEEGTDNNSMVIDETNKINLYCYLNRKETPKSPLYPFDWNMQGSQLLPYLIKLLNGNPKSEYKLLLKRNDDDYVWMEPEDSLYNLLVDDEMSLFLIDTKALVKIHMTDQSSKVLLFNPTLLVSELVTYTFEKIHVQETPGYTFLTYDTSEGKNTTFQPKALDTTKTIPEQIEDFSDLTFKRRFYVITLSDLLDNNILRQTYFDTNYYLKNGDVEITEEQAFFIAFYTLIIETPKGGSPKSTYESYKFDTLFPRSYKITAKTKNKFEQFFNKQDLALTPTVAMKKFVLIARDLPKFGSETISIQYRDMSKSKSKSKKVKYSDGTLVACPLLFIIYDSIKREVHRFFYQRILSCKVLKQGIFFTYLDEKAPEPLNWAIKTKDINTLYSMISSSMGLIRKLVENRQKDRIAQIEADKKKLNGGWVDENNEVRGRMLDMRFSVDLKVTTDLPRFWIEIEKPKEDLLERLYKAGKLDRSKKYSFLLQYNDEYHYLRNGKKISEFDPLPPRNLILFAIEEEPIIKLTTVFNQIKSMRLNIEKPLMDLIPEIAKKFGVVNYSGYTLFHINEKENRSLKLELTIPEQVLDYNELYFKRKFFSITNQDYIDLQTMRTIFNDVKDHLLSGNVEMTVDEALQLAAYALYVEIRNKPTEKDIPRDIQSLVPKGMSLKAAHFKQFKQYCLDIVASTEAIAIRKYLKIARDLVSFGSVQFTGLYYEKKKAKKINIFVAPESILIKSDNKIIKQITNQYLLSMDSAFKTIYLKYIDKDSTIISNFEFECETASDLIDVYRTYQNINKAILASNIPEVINESRIMGKNRIEIETGFRFSNTRYLYTYDKRYNGIQLACSAAKKLNKNPNGQYLCLLDKQGYREWILPTQILGNLLPYNRITMSFFETNQIVTITTYDNVSMKMIIDITQPVSSLVPFIADRLYVDNWIGYCLYTHNNKPLDYQKSIPEQTTEFDRLIFKRRIYLVTEWDVSSDNISSSIFSDFKRKFLTVNSKEFDKNQLIKNAVYIYYAINENTQIAQKMLITSEYDRISEILPADSIYDQPILRELNNVKSKAAYPRESAIEGFLRPFIHRKQNDNKDYNQFGYEKYQGKLQKLVIKGNEGKIQNPDMIIIIGPKAIRIKNTNKSYDIPYSSVTEFKFCNNFVLLRYNLDPETPILFGFTSEMSQTICYLIDAYISIVIPLLEEREEIQVRYRKEKEFLTNDNLVPIPTSKQMGHPNPPIYHYDPTYSTTDIAKQLYNFFLLKPDNRQILYHNRIKNHYQWLPNDDLFMLLNPQPSGQVYFIHDNPMIKVQTSDGLIIESSISLRNVVTTNVMYLLKALGKNFTTGFSIYPIQNNFPMRLDQTIPEQTKYYMELYVKRRFYIFPPSFFEEEESIYSLYDDCKLLFNDKSIKMTEERALDIALCAVYAENSTSTSFFHGFVPEDLAKFFPKSVLVNHDLGKKFFAYFKQMAPMTRFQASCRYIMKTIPIRGFGVELHQCFYTDALHTYKTPNKEALIHLGPFKVEVTNRSDYPFTEFNYDSIISCNIDQDDRYQIFFSYHDNSKEEQRIIIKCIEIEETYTIYEYIRQMFIYLTQLELIRTPNEIIDRFEERLSRKQQNTLNEIEEDDIIDYHDDLDYINYPENVNYDDYGFSIDQNNDNVYQIQDFTTSYEEYEYIAAPENAFDYSNSSSDYNSDYTWRTTEDGAKLDRAGKVVSHIENDCILIRQQLDSIQYQDLIDRFQVTENFLDELRNTVTSEEYIVAINQINNEMEEVRLTISKFEGNQGDMPLYTEKLKEQFQRIEDSLQSLKMIIEKEKRIKSNENQPISDPLVKNTIDVSRGLEELAISIGNNLLELQAKQQSDVINATHVMSERLTAIACAYKKTNDPQFVEVNIRPALHEATIMMKKIKKIGVTDTVVDDLLRLITAIDKMIVKTEESRNKVAHLMYFGDPQAIIASMSGFFMISNSLQQIKSTQSLDKYTQELISSTIDRISSSKSIINEQMLIIKKDPLNAIARHKIYYAILHSQDVTKQTISVLTAKNINTVKENNTLNYIDTAIKTISTINIVPMNISNVLGNINLFLEKNDAVKLDVLKANASQVEMNIIAETMTILKNIQFTVEQHQIELSRNFLNGDLLKLVQTQLIRIRSQYSKIKMTVDALEKATSDPTYSIIFERLQLSMNQTLSEKCPSESIDNCPHLGTFIQAINDIAVFINVAYYFLDNYDINYQSKSSILSSLKIIQNTYIELIKIHKNLIETSYDATTIQQAITQLQRLEGVFDNINDMAESITEMTNDPDFQRISLVANRSVKVALEDLKTTPKSIFRIPPNKTEVDKLTKLLTDLKSKCDNGLKPFLSKQIEKLKHENENPSDNFFRIANRVLNTLIKLNDDKYNGIIDQLKFFVNYDKPVVEDVKKLAQTALPIYQEFIDLLHQQSEQRPEYNSWELIIKHDIEIIETYLNDCDQFDYRSASKVKEAFMQLRNRLPYIPNELRTKLDNDTFVSLAKKLGAAHACGDRIINCVRNLPSTGIINIDTSKFNMIRNEDELCDSFMSIIDQIAVLKTIIKDSLHTSQVADQIHTQKLINQIHSILNDFSSSSKVESEEIRFLNEVKAKLPFIDNSINLISPIIGAEKLPMAMMVISQNVNLLLRYLTLPHMDAQTANQFVKEIKPASNKLLNELNKTKEDILPIRNKYQVLIQQTVHVDSLKLRLKQLLCDDLYLNSVTVLPQLFDLPNIDVIIDDILKIYEITSQYTSAKKTEIKFTDNLQCTKQLLQTEAIDEIINETSLYYNNIQQPGLVEKVLEFTYLINDQQEGLPLYIIDSLSVFLKTELLTNFDRFIASTNVNFNDRLNELIQISIIDTTKVAMIIASFRKTLNIINDQLTSAPQLFSNLAIEQFDSLQHSLSHVDTNLLLRNKSFATSVIAFVSIQDFQSNLVYFLDLIKDNPTIQPIALPLKDTLYDLHAWIYNMELSIVSVFYAFMDEIVCTCEEKKESGTMSFIRKLARYLLNKERLHVINRIDLQEVSKLFFEYQKKKPCPKMDNLLPIIHIWSNIDNEPPSILQLLSNLLLIHNLLLRYKSSSHKVIFSQIKSLNRNLQISSSKFKELKEIGNKLLNSLSHLTQYEVLLNDMISKSKKIMEDQLNKNKLNALLDQAKNDLKLIIDNSCLNVANKAYDYLKVLVAHINDIKDDPQQAKEDFYVNVKEKEFLPIPSFGMMSIINLYKNTKLNQNDFPNTNKLLFGTMMSYLSRQKYSFKYLSLIYEFPDEIQSKDFVVRQEDYEMALIQINSEDSNERRLSKQQAFIQAKILSETISTIPLIDLQSPEFDLDSLCDFLEVVRETNSKIDFYLLDITINSYLSLIRLISQLQTLLLILLSSKGLIKYSQSFEGQQKVQEVISNNDIIDYQRITLSLIEAIDFPSLLQYNLKDMPYEKLLSIIKIVKHLILLILENNSVMDINELFIQQQKIIKEKPTDLIFTSFLSIDLIDKSHHFAYNLLLKYIMATNLFYTVMNYFSKNGRYLNNPYEIDLNQQEEFLMINEIIKVNNSFYEQEADEYNAICALNLLRSILTVPISSQITTNIHYKPLSLMKNTKSSVYRNEIESFVTFDSVLQSVSHLTDASLMLSYIPSLSNDLNCTDDDIDGYLSVLHNSPSSINEYANEKYINAIQEELGRCSWMHLNDKIPSIILQSQLLKTASLVVLQNQQNNHEKITFNIQNMKNNYFMLLKLNIIYQMLNRFNDSSTEIDYKFDHLEEHINYLNSQDNSYFYNFINDESLLSFMEEMTEKERSSEKQLIKILSHIIYNSKEKVISFSDLKSKYDLNLFDDYEIVNINFSQYQQIVLAERIMTEILKTDVFSYNKNDKSIFRYNEVEQFAMVIRILLSGRSVQTKPEFISFCNHIVYELLTQNDLQEVNLNQIDMSNQSTSLQQSPIKKLLTKFAYSVHSLIYLFSTYSQLPIEECRMILESESKMALDLLKSQMLQNKSENIKEITEIIPQLLSTLTRSLSQFSQTDRESMLTESNNILPIIEKILVSSIDIEKEEEFRSSLIDLVNSISKINCVITNDSVRDIKENAIANIVDIIKARNNKEIKTFHYDLIQIDSLYSAENTRNKDLAFLKPISSGLQSIKLLAANSYSKNSFSDELTTKTESLLKILTDGLVKEIRNPFEISVTIKSLDDIESNLNEMNDAINRASNLIINSSISNELVLREVNKIIASFFESLATATKIFSIQKVQSPSLFEDFTLLLPIVTKSIRYLADLGQELQQKQYTSISLTSIKRAIRPFKRILSSLLDLIEDIKFKNIKYIEDSSQLLEKKLNFLNEIVNLLNYSFLTVSTKTYSQINEVFIERAKKATTYDITRLTKAYNDVLEMNVDKSIGSQFVTNYQDFNSIYVKFDENLKKNFNGDDLPIKFFYDIFCQLAIEVSKTVSQSIRLTDIKVEVPDIENASRLPKFYNLPTLKSDESRKKFQENGKLFLNNLPNYQKELDAFKSISQTLKNKEITDTMLRLICASDVILYDLLLVASTARTFDYQNTFSNLISTFSITIGSLIKSLKNRFLLRGDWKDTEKLFETMTSTIDKTVATIKDATTKADQEDKTHDATIVKINTTLKNLTETDNQLNQSVNSMKQSENSSIDIDWSIQMINIGRSLISGVSKVVLYEKGNTKSNIDPILKFADSINNQVKDISRTLSKVVNQSESDIEHDVIEIMTKISMLGKEFQKEKLDSKEENIMKDGIIAICRNAGSLGEMAKSAAAAKSMAIEKKKLAAESQRMQSKEKLLKRLEIESVVIRARILLERAEKTLAEMQ